jgi:heptosyltransferase III
METLLIYRLGSMGDTVVALPCFHKIAATFPQARKIVITNRPVSTEAAALEQILEGSGLVQGYIDYPIGLRDLSALADLAREIKASKARDLIYLTDRPQLLAVLRDVAFFRSVGIRRVVGAPLAKDQRIAKTDHETGIQEPEAERLARCLSSLGRIDLEDPSVWDLRLRRDEIERAVRSLSPLAAGKFIAVHIGTKDTIKDWGEGNWSAFLGRLSHEYPELGLVFVGAAGEAARCAASAKSWRGPTLNLCGQLPPRSSAVVLGRAILFVGHDSGPMHLAASQGTRCVALFGDHAPPRRWHPYGADHRVIHDMRGIRAIRPDEVFWQACEALNERLHCPAGTRQRGISR